MIEHYIDFDAHPEIEPLAGLVHCATPGCKVRALPRVATTWPQGKCDLCQDPELRALLQGSFSDAQRQLEDQGQREKRKLRFAERHPEPVETAPPDPNQTSLWSEEPLYRRKAA